MTLIYLVFGCLWILISDKVLHLTVQKEGVLEGIQTFKGILFVLLSALLIFGVLYFETSKRHKKEIELIKVQDEIKEQVVKAGEEERNRISAELHDGIQQELAAITMMIERMKEGLEAKDMEEVRVAVQNCVQEIRSISHDLSSFHVEQKGLEEALHGLSAINKKGEQVELHLNLPALKKRRLSYFTSLNLYRISQELLLNLSKHSTAQQVELTIEEEEDGHLVYRFKEDTPRSREESNIGFGEHSLMKRIDCLGGAIISLPDHHERSRDLAFRFQDTGSSEENGSQLAAKNTIA